MISKIKNQLATASALATVLIGNTAAAQINTRPTGSSSLSVVINNVLNAIMGIAALIVLAYIIIGGFNYLTSAGNAEKVTNAKNTIVYAIIGIIIIAVAFSLKEYIFKTIFGADITLPSV